jgi:hypothetical protein
VEGNHRFQRTGDLERLNCHEMLLQA